MDTNRFDRLATNLGTRLSRRSALSGSFGLATLLGVAGSESVAAKPKCKKPCGTCRQCQNKKCRSKAPGTPCGTCRTCNGGSCGNADDGTPCSGGTCRGGRCVPDTPSCVPPCTSGRICDSASGVCACPPDRPHSGGFCDDTCRECCIDDHCGRFSGKKCDHTQGSICVCASANDHDCGLLCQTCCAQEHCIPLIGDQSQCVDGGCRCNAGLTACFDPVSGQHKCTDTRTDEKNCGDCGRDCSAGRQCIGAACT